MEGSLQVPLIKEHTDPLPLGWGDWTFWSEIHFRFGNPIGQRCPRFRCLGAFLPRPLRLRLRTDPGVMLHSTASLQCENSTQEPNSEGDGCGLPDVTALRLLFMGARWGCPRLLLLPQAEACIPQDWENVLKHI